MRKKICKSMSFMGDRELVKWGQLCACAVRMCIGQVDLDRFGWVSSPELPLLLAHWST